MLVRGWFATVVWWTFHLTGRNTGGMRYTHSGGIAAAEACLCYGRLIILTVSHFYTDYQPIANLSKLLTYFDLHKLSFHIPSACPTQEVQEVFIHELGEVECRDHTVIA